ncbi:endo-1,3(4)-beta-glucanase [Marasmius fiardii PR-910]|nr:endo-1,3(4)-beta-glucanase [Marasmius fiardii PR-910]
MPRLTSYLVSLLPFVIHTWAASYGLADSYVGRGFLDGFNVLNIADPTHGRVNYVDAATASSQNLTYVSSDSFVLRADFTSVLNPSGPGRNSVRVSSKKTYGTSVMAFNIRHMPQGCGTWPALWSFAEPWPYAGEIDILEGVNDQGPNAGTLHTDAGCTMPADRPMTGTTIRTNCDFQVDGNAGCGVRFPQATSYGPPFNANGGGWYAVERTNTFIKIWFWPRNDPSVPVDVRDGATSVNTDTWGTPTAFFPDTQCPIAQKFAAHNIIINCGDWAGQDSIFQGAGCPGTCVDYVNNNPAAFQQAFFDFAWAKVYQ